MPWVRVITPRPPQAGQGTLLVPGLAPLPVQVWQVTTRGTSMVTSVPRLASMKSRVRSYRRSLPAWGRPSRGPKSPKPKMSSKTSLKLRKMSEKSWNPVKPVEETPSWP